jgi:hypothetical protein
MCETVILVICVIGTPVGVTLCLPVLGTMAALHNLVTEIYIMVGDWSQSITVQHSMTDTSPLLALPWLASM